MSNMMTYTYMPWHILVEDSV